MQICWAGHPGTTEQATCCIRCSSIKEVSLAGLPLPRRFKKAAMLGGESFDFYISLISPSRKHRDCWGGTSSLFPARLYLCIHVTVTKQKQHIQAKDFVEQYNINYLKFTHFLCHKNAVTHGQFSRNKY